MTTRRPRSGAASNRVLAAARRHFFVHGFRGVSMDDLAAELGVAYVSALQGDDLADGVLATGKHLVGHGLAEGGMNQAPAHIGPRELRDEQLLPFEAAVRQLEQFMGLFPDAVRGLITHRAALDDAPELLRAQRGIKSVVTFAA